MSVLESGGRLVFHLDAVCPAALAFVALAASWIPASAATKVNPLDAVRTDV